MINEFKIKNLKSKVMEITEIKQRLSIETVLQHYNLTPDRNKQICCPFHADDTPSCRIYPKTNSFHCFGCGATGDTIEFIERYERISKHEAITRASLLIKNEELRIKRNGSIVNLKSIIVNQSEILSRAFTHFVRSLNAKPKKATEYLESRKLDYKKLSIGYDAGSLHKMKAEGGKQKAENDSVTCHASLVTEYLQAGLLKPDKFGRANSYYTRFNNCIVFPLFDQSGNITSLYGRHIESGHHYLEGEHKGLYPGYPKEDTKTLILTESVIDAATLLSIKNYELRIKRDENNLDNHVNLINHGSDILALYGAKGFTETHEQAIKEWVAVTEPVEVKEVILFFDGDEAGREGVKATALKLKGVNENLQISVVDTPDGEDINSLAQSHESGIFAHLLGNRQPFSFSIEPFSTEKENLPPQTADHTSQSGLKITPDFMRYETAHLIITLWGGIEIHTVNRLRATLHIQLQTNEYSSFRDTADLYSYSQSDRLIKQAAEKLEISSGIVSEAITGLTKELEEYRQRKREEKRQSEAGKEKQTVDRFSKELMQQAADFMSSSNLTENTYNLLGNLGMIGQQENATLLFFIFLTRFFKNPLHAIVMGSSGSGKTHLLQGVAATVPKQHINITTSLSENTLYYTPQDFFKHKILLQEDLEGAYSALLPLRELMSNQSIRRFSTKTNSRTGDSKQVYLQVEGPVCVAGATTKDKVYEDNANRSFLIQIEENPQHEAQVLEYQGKVAAGLVDLKKYEQNINLLKACQLLVQPVEVLIPFAPELELPTCVFKKMRTMNHYLTLIKSVTLWNRRQRKTTTDSEGNRYLVSTLEDVEWANRLCRENLLRKSDELSGKTRNFFESLKQLVEQRAEKTFYAKDIRKLLRMHPMTLQRYFIELEKRGLIRCTSRNHKPGHEYEIIVWDDFVQLKSGMEIMDTILKKLKELRS